MENTEEKVIFISSEGNISIHESEDEEFTVRFGGEGRMVMNDHVFIESYWGDIDVYLPPGHYYGLSFQYVNGDIEVDANNIDVSVLHLLEVQGDIHGDIKYREIHTDSWKGDHYSNNVNTMKVKKSFHRKDNPNSELRW